MRILIVEDEALIAMMLTDSLEDAGHEVLGTAATAKDAMALCEASVPDLVIMDVNLGDGSNGLALAQALLRRWRLPVIFASAQLMDAQQARRVALGYLRKPYGPDTMPRCVAAADDVLHGRRPAMLPAGFELFRDPC